MISPPLRTLEMIPGPPEPPKSAAPESIALNSAEEAPMKTGSSSMPYFCAMCASLAMNQGRQLMPMGENGNGTFFRVCATDGVGGKQKVTIRSWTTQKQAEAKPEPRSQCSVLITGSPSVRANGADGVA